MDSTVRIAVDGQDGETLARQSGIRLVNDDEYAVVTRGFDGTHGVNAAPSIAGSPAGSLVVEISESVDIQGGLHAVVTHFVSRQQPPASVDVLVGRDLLLTARGGDGEPGRHGTDGQNGTDGRNGVDATRESDATGGTDAGNGGNAGHGSNGAIGGNGGSIDVVVSEADTHLLMAVQSDVSGGSGGEPGVHGQPGAGGKAGQGGSAHKWDETVGYRYYCTDQCVGHGEGAGSARSEFGANAMALVSAFRTQAVQGRELQEMIARVAANYGAQRNLNADPGRCKCGGGQGNCVGCGYRPVVKSFQRAQALNGRDGMAGNAATAHLVAGPRGQTGQYRILVRDQAMNVRTYESVFQLELVDFELEDENGDGIFEPGEHVLVRRIRVRNTGGMPSPACAIPISVEQTEDLLPDDDEAWRLYLPASVEPGTSVSLEGSVRALILPNEHPPKPGDDFKRRIYLSLVATMPWLERRLPYFELSRPLQVEYPCEIRDVQCLASLAQGDSGRIAWKVYNKSNISIGPANQRMVQVEVRFPTEFGTLQRSHDEPTEEDGQASQNADDISPGGQVSMQQLVRVAAKCSHHTFVTVDVLLYMDEPGSPQEDENDEGRVGLVLAQHRQIVLQISTRHYYNPEASVLLVINSGTHERRIQAIRSFVEQNMGMSMDLWNVDLYGGLISNGETPPRHIFERYRSKLILLLGNKFQFFDDCDTSVLRICDPIIMSREASHGTSFLFLESNDDEAFKQLIQQTVYNIPRRAERGEEKSNRCITLKDQEELVRTIAQEILHGSFSSALYSIPAKSQWYKAWQSDVQVARNATKRLQRELPQMRCVVSTGKPNQIQTSAPTDNGASRSTLFGAWNLSRLSIQKAAPDTPVSTEKDGRRIHVHLGLARSVRMTAATTSTVNGNLDDRPLAELEPMEKYSIVASFSATKTAAMIWSQDNAAQSVHLSSMVLDAATCSLKLALADEIKRYLRSAARPSAEYLVRSAETGAKSFLKLHLPTMSAILECPYATDAVSQGTPTRVQDIFRHALACCQPQKKRHVVAIVSSPLLQRRKELRDLLVTEIDKVLIAKGLGAGDLESWHAQAKSLHSTLKAAMRDTHRSIRRDAAELTRTSEHGFKSGLRSNVEVASATEYCSADQLDSKAEAIARTVAELRAIESRAQKQLDLMTVEDDGETPETLEKSKVFELAGLPGQDKPDDSERRGSADDPGPSGTLETGSSSVDLKQDTASAL